mmetsp:Transcript_38401/g.59320  ORF Transcript_38401/g.59320 Transcript_38401/m.59320 type:complete len:333 (-) Transcript_38401:337-1335(-)|eukprot:CAMPEP_0117027706 /NCGR_PEP_ID=MMETSP0472-20121206/20224_1 /TAXON_ID=693140 ORGANISM="Tiarina fusus, Strain LIS" /NCGR_SAMPLE_ID=MMETSP0472 /ASSEMBLY_ACC=CAM_ASM_000603 /LENGTH=332 /DNA_ID=CAMNT_0004735019 /DNA_START=254 /DNA_END=1252 /DNA_ORIENTATION=-
MPAPADSSTQRKRKFGLKRLFRVSKKSKGGKDDASRSVQFANPASTIEQGWVAGGAKNTTTNTTTNGMTKSQQQQALTKTTIITTNGAKSTTTQQQQQQQSQQPPKPVPRSWLAKTKFFTTMVNKAFDDIDGDGSNDIDEKELYSGLLLIHLQMGAYAGPAACKPISREKCHAVFTKMDVDGSGRLDKEEFSQVMMVLFGNVMMRVLFQYAATLMVVPLLAQYILQGIVWMGGGIPWVLQRIDPYTPVDEMVEKYWHQLEELVLEKAPAFAWKAGSSVMEVLDMVPESVWNTVPLTLLSTLLSMMIIPWTLMKIDDYFQSLADREQTKKKQH